MSATLQDFKNEVMLAHFAIGNEIKRIERALESLSFEHERLAKLIYSKPDLPIPTHETQPE